MSTTYFNRGSATSSDSPFYKLKNIPLLNKTNVEKISSFNTTNGITNLPVWRSAVANNYFSFDTGGVNVSLYSVNSAGTSSLITTVLFTTYLTNSNVASAYLSSADQCLYLLLYESPQYRLIKVNDASGAVTTIGAAFTPATANNWPIDTTFTSIVDTGSGLKIYYRGFEHTLNKTTGAIVSQDVAVTLGSYSLVNTNYVTVDGTIAIAPFISAGAAIGTSSTLFFEIISQTSGVIRSLTLEDTSFTDSVVFNNFSSVMGFLLVDNDKLFLGRADGSAGSSQDCFGYVYRSDFDQFLSSVVSWYIGG